MIFHKFDIKILVYCNLKLVICMNLCKVQFKLYVLQKYYFTYLNKCDKK